MKHYRVLRDCHWNHGYWEENQKVTFADDVKPPEHFQEIDRFGDDVVVPAEPIVPEPTTFSGINKAREKAQPKVGMAATSKTPVSQKETI